MANSVTWQVCVNSNIDKNYNPKLNTGKNKEIMLYAQKNIMKTCIFKYEIVLTYNEKHANIQPQKFTDMKIKKKKLDFTKMK